MEAGFAKPLTESLITFAGRYEPAVGAHLDLLLAWYVAVRFGGLPKSILPDPADTLATLSQTHYNWSKHVATATAEGFGGFFLAVVAGIAVAVVFSWAPREPLSA